MNTAPIHALAPILAKEMPMPGTHLLWLEVPGIANTANPGQFVMVQCDGGAFLRRPISIHRISSDKTRIALLFAVVGKGTSWLTKLDIGDRVSLLGPLGSGFSIAPQTKSAVLLAGGLGIAPLCFLADELITHGVKVSLLYGAATSKAIYPDRLLPSEASCVFATEDGSRGRRGFITTCLPEYLQDVDQVFACGPTPMYRTLAHSDMINGSDAQVSLETMMACGLGVCYGCTINTRQGPRQVCRHGPVFKLHDVFWDEFGI